METPGTLPEDGLWLQKIPPRRERCWWSQPPRPRPGRGEMDRHSRRREGGGHYQQGVSGGQSRDHSCSPQICVAHVPGQTVFTGAQPSGLSIVLSPNSFKEWPQQGVLLGCQQSSPGSVGGFRVGEKVQGQSLELVHPYLEAGPRPEDAAAWSSNPSLEQAAQDKHPPGWPTTPGAAGGGGWIWA